MPAGVYLHIPFCKSRCSYCDFATDVYKNADAVDRYVAALRSEIRAYPADDLTAACKAIDTIYFGGGTPSLLSPPQVQSILETVCRQFDVTADPEITIEINPATVSRETLAGYRSIGVNRASFGVQTFDDRALKLLARGHNADDARTTFQMLRDTGYENISFDLIAGLPGQTLDNWQRNIEEALSMAPDHLSLYLLEIHQGTPLAEQIRSGRRPLPDDDLAAEMYELMIDTVTRAGYRQYEISNFARPGYESRHNVKYWRLDPVHGFGVSAHSFDGFQRYANERDTAKYVQLIESGEGARASLGPVDAASEFAFLALRLVEGIDLHDYRERFGVELTEQYCDELGKLAYAGLIETSSTNLRLTRRGMLCSNEVFSVFV